MTRSTCLTVLLGLALIATFTADTRAMYDPDTGRFLGRDPGTGGPMRISAVGPAVSGRFMLRNPNNEHPDGMNLYQYVRSQPTISRDPSGLATEWDSDLGQCDQAYKECMQRTDLLDWWAQAVCTVAWRDCYLGVLPRFDSLDDKSPECDRYSCDDQYAGAYAKCFCKCAGNSSWSKFVRGCLRMMYDKGFDPHKAHMTCYSLADSKYAQEGRPWGTLSFCYAKCKDLNPFK